MSWNRTRDGPEVNAPRRGHNHGISMRGRNPPGAEADLLGPARCKWPHYVAIVVNKVVYWPIQLTYVCLTGHVGSRSAAARFPNFPLPCPFGDELCCRRWASLRLVGVGVGVGEHVATAACPRALLAATAEGASAAAVSRAAACAAKSCCVQAVIGGESSARSGLDSALTEQIHNSNLC